MAKIRASAATTPRGRRSDRRRYNKVAKQLNKLGHDAASKELARTERAAKKQQEALGEQRKKCAELDALRVQEQTRSPQGALVAAPVDTPPASIDDELRKLFRVGRIVKVAPDTSPNKNLQGGVGMIMDVKEVNGELFFVVDYTLGRCRREENIPRKRLAIDASDPALRHPKDGKRVSRRQLKALKRKLKKQPLKFKGDANKLNRLLSSGYLKSQLLANADRAKKRPSGWRRRGLWKPRGKKPRKRGQELPEKLADDELLILRKDINYCTAWQAMDATAFGKTKWGRKGTAFSYGKLAEAWGISARYVQRMAAKVGDGKKKPRTNAKKQRASDGGVICIINDPDRAKAHFAGKRVFFRTTKPPKGQLNARWDALSNEDKHKYEQLGQAKLAEQPYIRSRIVAIILNNRNVPWVDIATKLDDWCSEKVIRKYVQSFVDFLTYRESGVPAVTAFQKAQQVKHAQKVKAHWNLNPKPGQKFLFVHYDEKWFYGLVLRSRAKSCPSLGIKRVERTAKNMHHINQVMAVAAVGYCFTDDMANGGDGVLLGMYRCQKSQIAQKTQYHMMTLPNGKWKADKSRPAKYKSGDPVMRDATCVAMPSGTPEHPKYDLMSVWLLGLLPLLDKLVGVGGDCEGAKVIIQGDGAGTHRNAAYQTAMAKQCTDRGWIWDTQAPHMPHANVLDLALFPMMSKRHDKQRQQHGGVLKEDTIWENVEKVWAGVTSRNIAKSFLVLDQVLTNVIAAKGEVKGVIRHPPHGVTKQYTQTEFGYRRKEDAESRKRKRDPAAQPVSPQKQAAPSSPPTEQSKRRRTR